MGDVGGGGGRVVFLVDKRGEKGRRVDGNEKC